MSNNKIKSKNHNNQNKQNKAIIIKIYRLIIQKKSQNSWILRKFKNKNRK